MSYQTAKREDMWNKDGWPFSGWYVDNVDNSFLDNGMSPYLRNMRIEWGISEKRKGRAINKEFDYVEVSWDDTSKCMGIWHSSVWTYICYPWTANNAWIEEDSWIYSYNNWVRIVDTWWYKWWEGPVYFWDGWQYLYVYWPDELGKIKWVTYSTVSTALKPSFWVIFNSSHWISWDSSTPTTVKKSVADDFDDFGSTWSDSFTFGEDITWLAVNNNALFYFTKNTVSVTWKNDIQDIWWTISYITRPIEVKEWAVNHWWIVSAGNDIYYLTPSNKIKKVAIWANNGWFETFDISHKEGKWISTLLDSLWKGQTEAFWYYIKEQNIIKRYMKTLWSTHNDIAIVYNIDLDKFTIDNNQFVYMGISDSWTNLVISSLTPTILEDEEWTTDENAAIKAEYWTKEYDFGDDTSKKVFWETRLSLELNSYTELKQEIFVDWRVVDTKIIYWNEYADNVWWWIWTFNIWTQTIWEDSSEDDWMVWTYILRTKGNLNIKGKKIQMRYTEETTAWRLKLKQLKVKVEVLPYIATNLTK